MGGFRDRPFMLGAGACSSSPREVEEAEIKGRTHVGSGSFAPASKMQAIDPRFLSLPMRGSFRSVELFDIVCQSLTLVPVMV